MTKFHVLMTDEIGDEFSASVIAVDVEDAERTAEQQFPECSIIDISEEGRSHRDNQMRLEYLFANPEDDY